MTRTSLSATVLASATLLVAGCGGGSSSPGVAHLPSSTSDGSAAKGGGSSPESRASQQQKLVAYSQCMRSHGVPEFPDPTEGRLLLEGGNHNGHVTGVNPQSSQFQGAQKACAKLMPEGSMKPSPAQQAKMQEGALKFSQCMRTHGVPSFPDPTFSGGNARMTLKSGGANGIDPNSPQFKAAQKACPSLMGGPKGAPGGGDGPTSSSGGPGQGSSTVITP